MLFFCFSPSSEIARAETQSTLTSFVEALNNFTDPKVLTRQIYYVQKDNIIANDVRFFLAIDMVFSSMTIDM